MYKTACGNGFPLNIPSEIDGSGGGGDASSADKVSYDNTASGLSAENVQGAIDEIAGDVADLDENIYSTIATKIGKWLNDDLFRIVYHVNALPNTTTLNIPTSFASGSVVVRKIYGTAYSGTGSLPLPFIAGNAAQSFIQVNAVDVDGTLNLRVATGQDRSGLSGDIIVEYTEVTTSKKGGKK